MDSFKVVGVCPAWNNPAGFQYPSEICGVLTLPGKPVIEISASAVHKCLLALGYVFCTLNFERNAEDKHLYRLH
tara:strand:- start:276 stop:497 length:222 start_codon:yes stop_codon:yes gene_type:complete